MKKSYFKIALAVLISCLAVSAADAQSKAKVVKEGVGFDGITVGKSTEADVIKKFGKNYRRVVHKSYSFQMIYPNGVSFYICQSDKRKQIFDIELRAPFEAMTSKGIILGKSTLDDIYKIYGRNRDGGLQYRGVSFFYVNNKGKKTVTVIDIVESSGIRQCEGKK